MIKKILFLAIVLTVTQVIRASADTINRTTPDGLRYGWWILDSEGKPWVDGKSTAPKMREGRYVNDRREGVWICYHEDGKTPRLIGEYADNRPAGAYFRFDRKGALLQASAIPRRISAKQSVEASNSFFSCRMLFNQRDIVAGQVFFTNSIFRKDQSLQFWVEESVQSRKVTTGIVDYSWLTANYSKILQTYVAIRTPKKMRAPETLIERPVPVEVQNNSAKGLSYYYPPVIKSPRVAKGLIFQPNGFNKLYTEGSEIWVDGYFVGGQLRSGKVFIYDRDGVLLKVRVYKDGVYESDGVL